MLLSRHTRRREVIALIGGVAVAFPCPAVRGEGAERVRRIGVLMATVQDDPEVQARLAAARIFSGVSVGKFER